MASPYKNEPGGKFPSDLFSYGKSIILEKSGDFK